MSDRKENSEENKFLVVKDIVIPLVGILIAFVGLYASYSADKRQEKSAENATKTQLLADQSNREQKYLEFFLQNYSDSSSTKQETAFLLLKYINKDIRKDLLYSLSANTKLSPEAFKIILSYRTNLNFGIANSYSIVVRYAKEFKNRAELLKAQLDSAGFKGKTVLYLEPPDFFYMYLSNYNTNAIKYEPTHDSQAMGYLFRFIRFKNNDLNFIASKVPDFSSPNVIDVFIHTK